MPTFVVLHVCNDAQSSACDSRIVVTWSDWCWLPGCRWAPARCSCSGAGRTSCSFPVGTVPLCQSPPARCDCTSHPETTTSDCMLRSRVSGQCRIVGPVSCRYWVKKQIIQWCFSLNDIFEPKWAQKTLCRLTKCQAHWRLTPAV